ncbi:coenzyme F420-0:L-glutamate ligase [Candidatus Saccharibacteria bacterium]|nr:coenzyme F420-0:L-glutamate ligase [Candidatus Saccharibacteria bacterium]
MNIEVIPIKTRVVCPPKDEIWDIIDSLKVSDGDIVFITSKIVAIHQGRTKKTTEIEKRDLIKSEADRMLVHENTDAGFSVHLCLSHNALTLAAGIDESNADGYYILWPEDIDEFCKEVRNRLIKKFNLKNLGVVVTDSHTMPLRSGVTGFSIGLAGVEPLRDIRGTKDIFNRTMKITKVNLIDPLAALAVKEMGESAERRPIVILRGDLNIPFSDTASMEGFKIAPEMDFYRPLIETIPKV